MSKKITDWTKTSCRDFAREAERVLEELAREYGLTRSASSRGCAFRVTMRGGRYDPVDGYWCPKAYFYLTERKDGQEVEKPSWDRLCVLFHLRPEHYGTRFTARGEEYRVVALHPSRSRWPLECEKTETGQRYKFPQETIERLREGTLPKQQSMAERTWTCSSCGVGLTKQGDCPSCLSDSAERAEER